MQRIAQLIRRINTIFNIKSDFRRISIFHEKIGAKHFEAENRQKQNTEPHQSFTIPYKKRRGTGQTSRPTNINQKANK